LNFLSPNANIFSSGTEIGNETSQNPRIGTRKRQKLWYRKFQDVSAPAVPEEEEEEEEGLYLRIWESDLFVTRAKILIASEKLPGFVPNPARNLTAHKDRFLGRGEKCLGKRKRPVSRRRQLQGGGAGVVGAEEKRSGERRANQLAI